MDLIHLLDAATTTFASINSASPHIWDPWWTVISTILMNFMS